MDITLELQGISISFGNRAILQEVSYTFTNGIYVISGQSGIGKTTLLNIISGYLNPNSGRLLFKEDYKIGYCMQEDLNFSNLTVKENFYLKCIALEREDLFEEKNIIDILSKFHIEKLLESRVSELSGGEKQRLKMAMMLIESPAIILLDEPTSMLDEENKIELVKTIEQVWENKLLIISSHDELVFSRDTTLLRLEKGKLHEKE